MISAVAELATNRENFYMTFTVKEGPRYRLNTSTSRSRKDLEEPEGAHSQRAICSWQATEDHRCITDADGTAGTLRRAILACAAKPSGIDLTFQVRIRGFSRACEGNVSTLDRVIRREILGRRRSFNKARVRARVSSGELASSNRTREDEKCAFGYLPTAQSSPPRSKNSPPAN